MNRAFIIGNLTKDPETRVTTTGISVCNFTVAVNRPGNDSQTADFFRVTAWRKLADICQQYLSKGKKVCVIGAVAVSTYEGRNGKTFASLDMTAQDVEFLTPKNADGSAMGSMGQTVQADAQGASVPEGFSVVEESLPF